MKIKTNDYQSNADNLLTSADVHPAGLKTANTPAGRIFRDDVHSPRDKTAKVLEPIRNEKQESILEQRILRINSLLVHYKRKESY
jgi:hypothetical protein